MLREFHTTMHVHDDWLPGKPTGITPLAVTRSRIDLMAEEVRELATALAAGDIEKIADGIADVVYVAYGTAAVTGLLDLMPALLAEVHASNMTKTNVPGRGKPVKGPRYRPPDIAGILARAGA